MTATVLMGRCSCALSKARALPPNDIMVSHGKLGACDGGFGLYRTIVEGGKIKEWYSKTKPTAALSSAATG